MEIGIDIVEHERIKLNLASKILTVNEYSQFEKLLNYEQKVEYLASRFAAKEAIIKATNKRYLLNEIEILRTDNKPKININNIKLSISHEKKYSVAMCVFMEKE